MRPLRPEEQQWLFPKSALENTPSRADGISLQQELAFRKTVIANMRSLVIRVMYHADANMTETPNTEPFRGALTLGATLVHRFYMRRSFRDFDPAMMSATFLWMVSKLEENTMKLRFIVNCALDKFEAEKGSSWRAPWKPRDVNDTTLPSEGYVIWEHRLLTAEQIALETLCFDMFAEQPWVVLRRSISDLDDLIRIMDMSVEKSHTLNGSTNGHRRHARKINQDFVIKLAWPLLSESSSSPLSVLYPVPIIAFAAFALVISLAEQVPLSSGLSAASELGDRFGLDIRFSEDGPEGSDLTLIRDCLESFVEYTKAGLIEDSLLRYLLPEPSGGPEGPYTMRFFPSRTEEPREKTENSEEKKPAELEVAAPELSASEAAPKDQETAEPNRIRSEKTETPMVETPLTTPLPAITAEAPHPAASPTPVISPPSP